ncbi:hypothetical protein KO493_08745 [Tamlana agarivorans]|uniref:Uncharacterized protein n=1 Tax=Pseudotamlana agarivorans TaxID=481183 RepID=A0ACC5U966_9FLAO|nr:hypothetical protein [Tamlana agarivorans]MBU2950783.1 hypothetical protein [Tamlana agarivorans]
MKYVIILILPLFLSVNSCKEHGNNKSKDTSELDTGKAEAVDKQSLKKEKNKKKPDSADL